LLALSVALTPLLAEANSMPVRLERDPVFEIAPLLDTPLVVAKELLTFEVGPSSSEALVTADYQIVNPSAHALTIPMIFPAISEGEPMFRPQITLNNEELPFEILLAGSANINELDVNSILLSLNEPLYKPKSFKPTDKATLYEVTIGGQVDRQCTISFEFDPKTTKILASSYQGYQGSKTQNGLQVTFSRYVGPNTIGEQMTILTIGEDSLRGLTLSSGDSLVKKEVTLEGFLKNDLLQRKEQRSDLGSRNVDNLYSAVLKELDITWSSDEPFNAARPLDDLVNNVFYRNNLSVFMFTVEMQPESTNSLRVSYPVSATIDRSASADYVNTFAYILSPAKNFADFGTLDIEIRLTDHSPYILESSITLETDGSGRYFASLQGLPDVDLVFSTYTKPQKTPIDTLKARIISIRYSLLPLSIVFGFLLIITAILVKKPST